MLKIGHRGSPLTTPENTIPSFRRALELGADAIEMDVHISRDGEVMVIHDETVDRTTHGSGAVAELSCADIQALEVRGGGRVPTLRETLDSIGPHTVFMVEIKSLACGMRAAEIVMDSFSRGFNREQFWLISFCHSVVRDIKQRFPILNTGAVLDGIPVTLAQFASDAKADAMLPCIEFLTPDFMQDAARRGLKTFVWTANSAHMIAKARALKVDGVMTDDLDLCG